MRNDMPAPHVDFKRRGGFYVHSTGFWSPGRIVVSSDFMNVSLTDDQIEGVMAHECVHIWKGHNWLLVGPVAAFVGIFAIIGFNLVGVVLTGVGLSLIAILLRQLEYRADKGVASISSPISLAQALERLTLSLSRRMRIIMGSLFVLPNVMVYLGGGDVYYLLWMAEVTIFAAFILIVGPHPPRKRRIERLTRMV